MTTQTTPAPVSSGERLMLIDSIRGLAIFGILIINIGYYAWPKCRNWGIYPLDHATASDYFVDQLIYFLAKGKFYTIFSFLFGMGMAMQKQRFTETGRAFTPFFISRLFWLMVIGAVHGFIIWNGDILLIYALVGFPLLIFQNLKPRWLLGAAGLLFAWQFWTYSGTLAASITQAATPGGVGEQLTSWGEGTIWVNGVYNEAMNTYTTGSWMAIATMRFEEFKGLIFSLPGWWADLLISFLLGAWCWRKNIFTAIAEHRNLLKRVLLWGGAIGLTTNLLITIIRPLHLAGVPSSVASLAWFAGKYTLGYAYLAGLALLYDGGHLKGFFKALAPVGRMAMTNYLMHSVVFTLVFNSYGLGLMGRFGETITFLMGLSLFLIQIPLSKWWLTRFRFGPCEWLWRTLTYRKMQPMRRHAPEGDLAAA